MGSYLVVPAGEPLTSSSVVIHTELFVDTRTMSVPGSSVGKEFACNAGDPGSIPGWERSAEEGDRLPTPVWTSCGSAGEESACSVGDLGLVPGLGISPWRTERLPSPVFWPGEFHGGSPGDHKE